MPRGRKRKVTAFVPQPCIPNSSSEDEHHDDLLLPDLRRVQFRPEAFLVPRDAAEHLPVAIDADQNGNIG